MIKRMHLSPYLRRLLLFILGICVGILSLTVISAIWYLQSFSQASNLSVSRLTTIISQAKQQLPQQQTTTFLILGLDQRNDALESTLLTDTIIIARVDVEQNTITLLPVPRDLWIDELKTKINALYYYGKQKENTTPAVYTAEEIGRITGVTFDYWVVINYQKLDDLVDQMGGITIDVPQSFTDNNYPNPDYLTDPVQPIYTTVSFQTGIQTMNGERTLAYVRSRSSDDLLEGSDLARSSRQTQVFNALIKQISEPSLFYKPDRIGSLYRFWHENMETNISDSSLVALGLSLNPHSLSYKTVSIPASFSDDKQILFNPPLSKYGLWVWEPRDSSWEELREFIKNTMQ
jgi:LCP family protein required for cell wall assembly